VAGAVGLAGFLTGGGASSIAWLGALGAGGAAGTYFALKGLQDWLAAGLPPLLRLRSPTGESVPRSEHSKSRIRRIARELGKQTLEVLKEAAGGTVGAIVVTNLVASALAADVYARQNLWIKELSLPTFEALDYLYTVLLNIIAAGVVGDAVSGTDVASDILESMLEAVFEKAFADTIAKLWEIMTPTESVDDDEIRDIVNAGSVNTPSDIALMAILSGLERYSAFAEIYTGLIEGLFGYYRYLADYYGDWARRLIWAYAPKLYYLWHADKYVQDLMDAAYWALEAVDAVVNYARKIYMSLVDYWVAYRTGEIDQSMYEIAEAQIGQAFDALLELLDKIEAAIEHMDLTPLVYEIENWRTEALSELDKLWIKTKEYAEALMKEAEAVTKQAYEIVVQ